MKKILIVINDLEFGGIQKALIEFLHLIADKYDIFLRCFSHTGEYLKLIPEQVTLLPEKKKLSILSRSMAQLKFESKARYIEKGIWSIMSKMFGSVKIHKIFFKGISEYQKYDIAISYSQDISGRSFSVGCNDYVTMCVTAEKKYSFVHCDFSEYGGNDEINRARYKNFDKIICVSEGCRDMFAKCCPEYSEKLVVVKNHLDVERVRELSHIEPYIYDSSYINLITVARLSEEKGLMRMLSALSKVVSDNEKNGSKLRWYIVGDGPLRNDLENAIKEKGLSDRVYLMGSSNNPYRYMLNADCLVLPSFHECAPVVFGEATSLCLPVLTTATISAREMIELPNVGWVCENSEDGLAYHLIQMVNHRLDLPLMKRTIEYKGSGTFEAFEKLTEG